MDHPFNYEQVNLAKADFESIYNEPDPRSYYRVLGGLDYVVPGLAAPVFRQLIAARAAMQDRPVTILDLGCSYGVTSALLRFPVSFDQLRRRYMMPEMQTLSPQALTELDRAYFQSWPSHPGLRVIGLDPSSKAVRYARDVGILDIGIDDELETREPSARCRAALSEVDIVISTGCVGYVTHRTFERILACNKNEHAPWVASFVLRAYPYTAVEAALGSVGLETEKFDGATFVQRRFFNASEYELMLATLEEHGIDPTGLEADGLLHAELFVSRPQNLARAQPLGKLVSIVSGQSVRYGRRYHRIPGMGARQLLLT